MDIHLPPKFIDRLLKDFDLTQNEAQCFLESPSKSIRLNPRKSFDENLIRIPWAQNGRYLSEHPIFMHDPRWLTGRYFVQSSTSMLLELAWKTILKRQGTSPNMLLDLCASPGGKTTHLLDLMDSDSSLLVANEIHPKRNLTLCDNLVRWGNHNQLVIQQHPKDIPLDATFDFILVDAPCSGEGLFSEYPKAIEQWSSKYVETCASRQSDIVNEATRLLATDGYLLYSTCTANHQENSDIVRHLIRNNSLHVIELSEMPDGLLPVFVEETLCGYQALPHSLPGRAFFFCLLQKDDLSASQSRIKKSRSTKKPEVRSPWIRSYDGCELIDFKGIHSLIPEVHSNFIQYVMQALHARSVGTPIHDISKGVPHIGLALHHNYGDHLEKIELDAELAVQYLTGHALPGFGTGWKMVSYEGSTLGWVKSIGKRSNNFFPKPWRLPRSVLANHIRHFSFN